MTKLRCSCPLPSDFDLRPLEEPLRELHLKHPLSFKDLAAAGQQLGFEPATFALLLETVELRDRGPTVITPNEVWKEAVIKHVTVMTRAVRKGTTKRSNTSFLPGNWGMTLAGRRSLLDVGWGALTCAIAVQEYNAAMGLVSAAPTGGASGTVPGTLIAVAKARRIKRSRQVSALFVAGLVGLAAFRRGPVSGAQAGCGGEVGVAACMAAGAVAYLLGGNWDEIDAAGALAGTNFVGLECSPTNGLVEYPCVPRNGFAAVCAIGAGEMACAGIRPPYGLDETLDRIFGVGRLLPAGLKETNDGPWAAPACWSGACDNCGANE